MAPTTSLGKRKRVSRAKLFQEESPVRLSSLEIEEGTERNEDVDEDEDKQEQDLQDIFRRAFEAKFKPLQVEKVEREESDEDEDEDEDETEEDDWDGISDSNEEDGGVEVVDYTQNRGRGADEALSKSEMRKFMSSKPPSILPKAPLSKQTSKSKSKSDHDSDDDDSTNIANDMALQKLLRDSHILSSNDSTSSSLTVTGRSRHISTDLTLLSLGAKTSIRTQVNMPMAHRKGMVKKQQEREEKRRKEARENGIILEKEVKKGKKRDRERGLDVGGPGVGKFRGGELRLSKRDVSEINGGGRGGARGGRGGRGGRGRGGGKRARR